MPNIKNLQFKNREKEKEVMEKVGGTEEKVEKGVPKPERETGFEGATVEKEQPKEGQVFVEKTRELVGVAGIGDVQQEQKQREKQIEKILEEGLEDIYMNMPPDKQQEFKREGERTVREINNLLNQAKTKVKKIINLIKKWLSIIPGVNKFFLEQEAKIKADEILKIKNV